MDLCVATLPVLNRTMHSGFSLLLAVWICLVCKSSGLLAGAKPVSAYENRYSSKSRLLISSLHAQCEAPVSTYRQGFNSSQVNILKRPISVAAGFAGVVLASRNPLYQLKPIEAVPLVSLLGSIVNPTFVPSMYAGAFGGLTSLPVLMNNPMYLPLMAMFIAGTHEVWERLSLFRDCGGRLGFSTATGLTLLLLLNRLISPVGSTLSLWPGVHHFAQIRLEPLKLLQLNSLVFSAALATIQLRSNAASAYKTETKDKVLFRNIFNAGCMPVRASASVALLAATVCSRMQLTYCGGKYSINAAAATLMGTFLGMRDLSHYKNASGIWKVGIQSVLSVLFLMVLNITPLGKIGGILGVCAVFSTLLVDALARVCQIG